jgi:hypothetical protein
VRREGRCVLLMVDLFSKHIYEYIGLANKMWDLGHFFHITLLGRVKVIMFKVARAGMFGEGS